MIKTVLIEDEVNVRASLRKMLHLIEPRINIIAETGFVKEAITIIETHKPDVVFIDIQLEDGTGFDILKHFNHLKSKVIFTTAYNEYAITAFKHSATDYLLKPINPNELKNAIERVINDIDKETQRIELLNVLKDNIEKKDKKIVLKTYKERHILLVKDIVRLEADTAYTTFYTKENKIVISKNLKYYEELLGDDFLRCHQSHLVNINHVVEVSSNGFLKMTTADLIPISTRKKSQIIQKIKDN